MVSLAKLDLAGGPVADRIAIWPMEDGTYGLDATFQGATGFDRAEQHKRALAARGVDVSFLQELGGAWTLRFGPISREDVSAALQAFVV